MSDFSIEDFLKMFRPSMTRLPFRCFLITTGGVEANSSHSVTIIRASAFLRALRAEAA